MNTHYYLLQTHPLSPQDYGHTPLQHYSVVHLRPYVLRGAWEQRRTFLLQTQCLLPPAPYPIYPLQADPRASLATLMSRVARLERQQRHMVRICLHCGGGGGGAVGLLHSPAVAGAPGGSGLGAGARGGAGVGGRAADGGGAGADSQGGSAGTAAWMNAAGATAAGPSNAAGGRGSAAVAAGACAGAGGVVCDSLDCGVYFERRKLAHELSTLAALTQASCQAWDDFCCDALDPQRAL